MIDSKQYISNKIIAYNGAAVAVASVFAYSIIIMTYVIIRSSVTIYSIMAIGERNTILLTNGFSIAYSVAVFSLLMALLSTITGAMAALLLKKSLLYFNSRCNYKKAVAISFIIAFTMLVLLYLLFYALLKDRMTLSYRETFSFWFLFPAVIFFTAVIIGGYKLNKVLNNSIKEVKRSKEN